ncbi:MAG: SLATT domain-containing protein, partial [Planctomycetota bacterium]
PVLAGVRWIADRWPLDGQLGFVFLGVAGACFALDRYFGFTSGWIRYVTTAVHLQQALARFQLDWAVNAAGAGRGSPDAVKQLEVVRALFDAVYGGLVEETDDWARDFRASLDKSLRDLVEEMQAATGKSDAQVRRSVAGGAVSGCAVSGCVVSGGVVSGGVVQSGAVPGTVPGGTAPKT